MRFKIPRSYWDDFSDRAPCDHEDEMPNEISLSARFAVIEANAVQIACLLGDAEFYAGGNTDDTPRAVVSGARRVVEILKAKA
jgi:hypothetical protein